eukprot:g2906.t1
MRLIAYCQTQKRSGTAPTPDARLLSSIGYINLPLATLNDIDIPEQKKSVLETFAKLRAMFCVGIFQMIAKSQDPSVIIPGAAVVNFFRSSGLPNDVLRSVWSRSVEKGATSMGRDAFLRALDLVQKAQEGIDINDSKTPLNVGVPVFMGMRVPQQLMNVMYAAKREAALIAAPSSSPATPGVSDEAATTSSIATTTTDQGAKNSAIVEGLETSSSARTTEGHDKVKVATEEEEEEEEDDDDDDGDWGAFSSTAERKDQEMVVSSDDRTKPSMLPAVTTDDVTNENVANDDDDNDDDWGDFSAGIAASSGSKSDPASNGNASRTMDGSDLAGNDDGDEDDEGWGEFESATDSKSKSVPIPPSDSKVEGAKTTRNSVGTGEDLLSSSTTFADPMAAFDELEISDNVNVESHKHNEAKNASSTSFAKGDVVLYVNTSSGSVIRATIVGVHIDDPAEPTYFTVQLGLDKTRERQTVIERIVRATPVDSTQLFNELSKHSGGSFVPAKDAACALRRSRVSRKVLHKIWSLAEEEDRESRSDDGEVGGLCLRGFTFALTLISLAQCELLSESQWKDASRESVKRTVNDQGEEQVLSALFASDVSDNEANHAGENGTKAEIEKRSEAIDDADDDAEDDDWGDFSASNKESPTTMGSDLLSQKYTTESQSMAKNNVDDDDDDDDDWGALSSSAGVEDATKIAETKAVTSVGGDSGWPAAFDEVDKGASHHAGQKKASEMASLSNGNDGSDGNVSKDGGEKESDDIGEGDEDPPLDANSEENDGTDNGDGDDWGAFSEAVGEKATTGDSAGLSEGVSEATAVSSPKDTDGADNGGGGNGGGGNDDDDWGAFSEAVGEKAKTGDSAELSEGVPEATAVSSPKDTMSVLLGAFNEPFAAPPKPASKIDRDAENKSTETSTKESESPDKTSEDSRMTTTPPIGDFDAFSALDVEDENGNAGGKDDSGEKTDQIDTSSASTKSIGFASDDCNNGGGDDDDDDDDDDDEIFDGEDPCRNESWPFEGTEESLLESLCTSGRVVDARECFEFVTLKRRSTVLKREMAEAAMDERFEDAIRLKATRKEVEAKMEAFAIRRKRWSSAPTVTSTMYHLRQAVAKMRKQCKENAEKTFLYSCCNTYLATFRSPPLPLTVPTDIDDGAHQAMLLISDDQAGAIYSYNVLLRMTSANIKRWERMAFFVRQGTIDLVKFVSELDDAPENIGSSVRGDRRFRDFLGSVASMHAVLDKLKTSASAAFFAAPLANEIDELLTQHENVRKMLRGIAASPSLRDEAIRHAMSPGVRYCGISLLPISADTKTGPGSGVVVASERVFYADCAKLCLHAERHGSALD